MELKNIKRGRIKEYADKYPKAKYTPMDAKAKYNPLWDVKADATFPSATQNEINEKDAQNLVNNGVYCVSEGANMPTTADGVKIFLDKGILYAPGKASNAGGVVERGMNVSWDVTSYGAAPHRGQHHVSVQLVVTDPDQFPRPFPGPFHPG
jgi:glutamate dehydrogenase (NADP+)